MISQHFSRRPRKIFCFCEFLRFSTLFLRYFLYYKFAAISLYKELAAISRKNFAAISFSLKLR